MYHRKGSTGKETGSNNEGLDKMDPAIKVSPEFKCKDSLDENEFKKQLSNQENAINNMTVSKWLGNRDAFIAIKDMKMKEGKKNASGRDPEGDKKVKEVRECLQEEYKFKLLNENPSLENSPNEIERQVNEYGKSKAVLHRLDQIAGGVATKYGDDASIFGNTEVNSDIGNQWDKRNKKFVDNGIKGVNPEAKMDVNFHSHFYPGKDEEFIVFSQKGMTFFKENVPGITFTEIKDNKGEKKYYLLDKIKTINSPRSYPEFCNVEPSPTINGTFIIKNSDDRFNLTEDSLQEIN